MFFKIDHWGAAFQDFGGSKICFRILLRWVSDLVRSYTDYWRAEGEFV